MLRTILYLYAAILIILVFRSVFQIGYLVGGDAVQIYPSMYPDFSLVAYAWRWSGNAGLGGYFSPFLSNYPVTIFISLFGNTFGFTWDIVTRITQVLPFLLLSITSPVILYRKLFSHSFNIVFVPLLFLCNTYALLLFGGGQLMVGLAYAVLPLVLATMFLAIKRVVVCEAMWRNTFFYAIILGFVIALQLMFDVRIMYVSLVAMCIYFFFILFIVKDENSSLFQKFKRLVTLLSISAVTTLLLHTYWLLPTLMTSSNPLTDLGSAYTTANAVSYFSFAFFENSFALLHPNWPENIFGKVAFMRPEFLLLPLFAFASLWFIRKDNDTKKEERTYVLYFVVLGLVGVFLAKGTNDPFGLLYSWMFAHVPGFIMFRDPTKWYVLVALAYSILIPYTLERIIVPLKNKKLSFLIVGGLLLYVSILLLPALTGNLTGLFQSSRIPGEYRELEHSVSSQPEFFRTLWVPRMQRFGYASGTHPGMSAAELLNKYSLPEVLTSLKSKETQILLEESSVKYIIIPADTNKEIFLTDRKYDSVLYEKTVAGIKGLSYVTHYTTKNDLTIFQLNSYKPFIWSPSSSIQLDYIQQSPVSYSINIQNGKVGDLVILSQSFDPQWIATGEGSTLHAKAYNKRWTSFILEEEGNYSLNVFYTPQKNVTTGVVVSGISVLGVALVLLILYRKKAVALA